MRLPHRDAGRARACRSVIQVTALVGMLGVALGGCAPRLQPLGGAPAPQAAIPPAELPAGHTRIIFDWTLSDQDLTVRGEGVARLASPDSGRLDFFVGGGMGGGWAVLVGDTLRTPGSAFVDRVIPPKPLLWATLGRLALPPMADTTARLDGELLAADIGTPVAWRVTFRRDSLVRVERVVDGRVIEWVDRSGASVRYRHEPSRRELTLTVTSSQPSPAFDASIWRP